MRKTAKACDRRIKIKKKNINNDLDLGQINTHVQVAHYRLTLGRDTER